MKSANRKYNIVTALLITAVVLAFVTASGMIISLAAGRKSSTKESIMKSAYLPQFSAIVRLHRVDTGKFFCSGTVIDKYRILTAAHCIPEVGIIVEVRPSNGMPIGVQAIAISRNDRADVMLLGSGNLGKFENIPLEQDTSKILQAVKENKLQICGYPWSGKLFCSPFDAKFTYYFAVAGKGNVYPGMSGGPMIDLNTGKVIGCISGGTEEKTIIAPAIELDALLSN